MVLSRRAPDRGRLHPRTSGSPRQWRAYVKLLGDPEALEGEHWGVPLFRLMNADVIRVISEDALREALRGRSACRGAAARRADHARQHAGRVRGRGADPRPGLLPADRIPAGRRRSVRRVALHFSRTPAVLVRPAPAPGEDGPGFGPRVAEPPTGDGGRRAPVLDGVRVVDLGVGVAIPEAGSSSPISARR